MNAMILTPFAIGTLAFFSTLLLTLRAPQPAADVGRDADLRRWDTILTGIMWGGWGCAALMTFLDENGFLAALRS